MEQRTFTREELAEYDGKEGRPAYVAAYGKVYDASDSALWEQGEHFDEHYAGRDLTEELDSFAPHGPENLDFVSEVGVLSE